MKHAISHGCTNITTFSDRYKGVVFLLTLGTLGGLAPHQAIAALIYSNDFSVGAGSEWSNPTTAVANGEHFLGASASGFGNGSNILTLSGLPAHTDVTVNFDLYIIQTWDGNGPQGGGPDNWQLTANGVNLLFTNFANYTQGNTQTYPNQLTPFGSGGAFAPRTDAFDNGHLGFGTGDGGDATYRFTITYADTSPNIAFAFTSFQNQAPGDEGWGLDNVRVSVTSTTTVPEPASVTLLAVGLAGLGCVRRGRKETSRVAR